MQTEIKPTNSLESLKIHEIKELLKKVGLTIEAGGEITDKTPGTVCAYYVRPLSGSWTYLWNKFFYSRSMLNTWADACKILKKNLMEKEQLFEELGIKKSLRLQFENGEFIVHEKIVKNG